MLAPLIVCVIVGIPEEIMNAQALRGGQVYTPEVITKMQNCEIDHAIQVANQLGIPFIQAERTNLSLVIPELKRALDLRKFY